MSLRVPYRGTGRKLLLAFDVGTTYSGISYALVTASNVEALYSL